MITVHIMITYNLKKKTLKYFISLNYICSTLIIIIIMKI